MKKFSLNTIVTKFKGKYLSNNSDSPFPVSNPFMWILILGITAGLAQVQSNPKTNKNKRAEVKSLDTFIPEGESLVPIQVSNYESLDQIIGQYGVVDLLSTPLNQKETAKRIAYGVKLIRSPKSPRHFSVLIPADKAHKLAGFHGQFTVVVRNPKLIGTQFVKPKGKSLKRRVIYEMETL